MQGVGFPSIPWKNSLITVSLFVCTLFINKYVLSTLKFQYPTIYQGWQTLVGVILFRILVMSERIEVKVADISRFQVLVWLPPMLLFVWSIYSGSVALSQLAVPCFLSQQNVILLAPLVVDVVVHQQCKARWRHLVAAGGIWISALMIYLVDDTPHGTGYAWMVLHIVTSAAITVYQTLMKHHINISEYQQTFLNYALSVFVLAPSTILLGDAVASRRHFAFWYYYRFYVCCVMSGVCGICLTLHIIRTRDQPGLGADATLAISKLVASVLSVLFFTFHVSATSHLWIFMNLACGILLQYPVTEWEKRGEKKEEDKPKENKPKKEKQLTDPLMAFPKSVHDI